MQKFPSILANYLLVNNPFGELVICWIDFQLFGFWQIDHSAMKNWCSDSGSQATARWLTSGDQWHLPPSNFDGGAPWFQVPSPPLDSVGKEKPRAGKPSSRETSAPRCREGTRGKVHASGDLKGRQVLIRRRKVGSASSNKWEVQAGWADREHSGQWSQKGSEEHTGMSPQSKGALNGFTFSF